MPRTMASTTKVPGVISITTFPSDANRPNRGLAVRAEDQPAPVQTPSQAAAAAAAFCFADQSFCGRTSRKMN
ncbi:MAG: hypothetical protein IIZ15_00650, partial [Coriobacteriales bacterium]|nr:hypothetical protein [Coriobacteriales bacterium]